MTTPTATAAVQIAREMGVTVEGAHEIAVAMSALRDYSDDLARRLEDIREKEKNDRRFGAFYTTAKVMSLLGSNNRQSVTNMIRRNTVLRVRTADGRNAFPALQFDQSTGKVIAGLRPVLQVLLPAAATEWTVLDWLVTPMPELEDRRAIDALATDADLVLRLARQDAAAWTG